MIKLNIYIFKLYLKIFFKNHNYKNYNYVKHTKSSCNTNITILNVFEQEKSLCS